MSGLTIDKLAVGDTDRFTKTISESDIYTFAGVSGDLNPAHIDEEFAKTTVFEKRIAHGFLIGGLISTVIGTRLPGPGSIYREQTMNFLAPVYIGDTITAQVEITELDTAKNKIALRTWCTNQDGKTVIEGGAVIHPPRPKK